MQDHLGREVGARALHAPDALGGDLLADAVVRHFDVDGSVGEPLSGRQRELPNQDVLRLQVPIDVGTRVEVVQGLRDLHTYIRT